MYLNSEYRPVKASDLFESISSFVDYFECHFQLKNTRIVIGLNLLSNLIFLTYPAFTLCNSASHSVPYCLDICSFCRLLSNFNHWKLSCKA